MNVGRAASWVRPPLSADETSGFVQTMPGCVGICCRESPCPWGLDGWGICVEGNAHTGAGTKRQRKPGLMALREIACHDRTPPRNPMCRVLTRLVLCEGTPHRTSLVRTRHIGF